MKMLYGLNDKMPKGHFVMYGLQHLVYFLAGCAIMPVIVGVYLGLDQVEIAQMLQRTFLLSGIVSILQVTLGHRYPIIDGPAGLWMGMLIILSGSATAFGKELSVLRSDLELGMLIAGVVVILIGISGLMPKIAKIFNPIVNGTFLMLMVLQLSSTILKGATGITSSNSAVNGKSVFVFILTTVIIVVINLKAQGFLQSIATLIGVSVGWITAFIIDIAPAIGSSNTSFISLPEFFAWGSPTFDFSVVITCALGCIILFSNLIASITGMSEVVDEPTTGKQINRGAIIFGLSTIFIGLTPTVGFVPFASSMGATAMTRVASRRPFILGSIFMIILGLISPVGAFFSAIPPSVGYSAMMIIFALMFRQALSEFRKIPLGNREGLTIGITMIVGIGIMFLPLESFRALPQMIRYIASNGLVVGILLVVLLEHLLLNETLHAKFKRRS